MKKTNHKSLCLSAALLALALGPGSAIPCEITNITVNTLPCYDQGTPNPADDTFITDFTIYFSNQPTTGQIALDVRGQTFSTSVVGLNETFQFLSIPLAADSSPVVATARFTADSSCNLTKTVVDAAPGPCSADVVPLDIKPGSCPNPLNCKSKGVLSVAILGTADFNVTAVDPATVLLGGVAPLRWDLEDVAGPVSPLIGKQDCYLDCYESGPDGYEDATFKFKVQELVEALGEDVLDGNCLVVELTGNLRESAGGDEIFGEDVVVIRCE